MKKTTTKSRDSAFTLVEIIIVLVTIGVIAGMAIPKYQRTVERFRAKEGEQILLSALGSQKRFHIDHGNYMTDTDTQNFDIDTPSTYFNTVTITTSDVNDGFLASITRGGTSPVYQLKIYTNAQIICTNDSPAGFCGKIGY